MYFHLKYIRHMFNTTVNAIEYNSQNCSQYGTKTVIVVCPLHPHFVVVDLPLLRVAVEGSDNPISLEKACQASLPPDQQGHHSLGRHPEVQYAV